MCRVCKMKDSTCQLYAWMQANVYGCVQSAWRASRWSNGRTEKERVRVKSLNVHSQRHKYMNKYM